MGAHIHGGLELDGAQLTNHTGPALIAEGFTINGTAAASRCAGRGERLSCLVGLLGVAEQSPARRASREVRTAVGILTAWLPRYFGVRSDPQADVQARAHLDFVRQTEGAYAMFSGQFALNLILLEKLATARGATPETMFGTVLEILHEITRDFRTMR